MPHNPRAAAAQREGNTDLDEYEEKKADLMERTGAL
jgi:hypothetical protein